MLKNALNNKIICQKTRLAKTFFSRFRGLMFELKHDFGLIFVLEKPSIVGASIHMFFVFFPIDVVYLNEQKIVIDLVSSFQPFSLNFSPKMPAKYFIELPNETIKKSGIKLGQKLDW